MLNEFYAVTMTSAYHVKDADEKGMPIVEKIALKTVSPTSVGQRLTGGSMVAICKSLIMYFPEKYGFTHPLAGVERKIEMVNNFYWGGCTSQIVALFKTKKDALACLKRDDLNPCDSRWVEKTQEVLEAIGNSHPVFEICHFSDLALPCVMS